MEITQEQLNALVVSQVKAVLAGINKEVKLTPKVSDQVAALPVGVFKMRAVKHTKSIPVPKRDENGKVILQTSGQWAGRPKANGFKKQNRKFVEFTWANGQTVTFMKTQDSNNLHDSRTPTVRRTKEFVLAEFKRLMPDENRALKGIEWLMNVDHAKQSGIIYGKLASEQCLNHMLYSPMTAVFTPETAANYRADITKPLLDLADSWDRES